MYRSSCYLRAAAMTVGKFADPVAGRVAIGPSSTSRRSTMNGTSNRYEPSRFDYVPERWCLDRRRFLRVAGLAGIGIVGGTGWSVADEPLRPESADPKVSSAA